MHYHVEVWLKTKPRNHNHAEAVLQEVLASFEGDYWDWWVIGGRWTGEHDGYDPTKDPVNIENCGSCNGTGDRPGWVKYVDGVRTFTGDGGNDGAWSKQCNGCNGCHGAGRSVKFSYAPHAEDIMALKKIPKTLTACAIVVEDVGEWYECPSEGGAFDGKVTQTVLDYFAKQRVTGGYLVTVDAHN